MPIIDKQIKFSFLREYHLILQDFDKILGFVDPSDENEIVFSHRIFELLLRTCTALETVFKRVLKDQNYKINKSRLDIKDYFTVNSQYKLSEYEVMFDSWRSGTKIIKPFEAWNTGSYARLVWYQAYNDSKHDRDQNFKDANLKNLTSAIAGLTVLLHSQYKHDVFGKYQETMMTHSNDQGFKYSNDSIFSIKIPQ